MGIEIVRPTVVHENSADYLCASWGDVLVCVWRDHPTLEGVAAFERGFDVVAAEYPPGILLLTVVEEKSQHPDAEVRAALSRFLVRGVGRFRKAALVHEGSGFHAAIVRSIATEVNQLASATHPRKVFPTIADAARFFEPELGPVAGQMAEAVQGVRNAAASW